MTTPRLRRLRRLFRFWRFAELAALAAVVSLVAVYLGQPSPAALLLGVAPSPQTIIGKRVFSVGSRGPLHVIGFKCLTDYAVRKAELVPVEGQFAYVRQDDGRTIVLVPAGSGAFNPSEAGKGGCLRFDYRNVMPTLHAGVWRIEGHTCVIGRPLDCQAFVTQTFTVKGDDR